MKKGKTIELSDEALELLEKQYPIPKPVQIIKGVPQEEYDKLLKMYAAAEKEIADIQSLRMEETKMLMETKEKLFQLEDKSRIHFTGQLASGLVINFGEIHLDNPGAGTRRNTRGKLQHREDDIRTHADR